MLIDRAGLSVRDGATHHGIFDVAFLSTIPCVEILSPITYGSLSAALRYAANVNTPIAIRYPNAPECDGVSLRFYPSGNYESFGVLADYSYDDAPENVIVTYGGIIKRVISAVEAMKKQGRTVGIILLERLKPYDALAKKIMPYLKNAKRTLFVEEGIKGGGAAMNLASALYANNLPPSQIGYKILAIDDSFGIPNKKVDLYDYLGFSDCGISKMLFEEE